MINELSRVRQNYLAITLAAVACFLFEAAWYSYFLQTWLDGIGRTQQWLDHTGVNLALQFGTALLSEAVIAGAISCVTQLTGPQTALRGMRSPPCCGSVASSPPGLPNTSSKSAPTSCSPSTPASG